MDELTLFAELKPPVPEVGPSQARARARVVDGLRANRSRGRRFALRGRPASARPRRRRLALGLSAVAVAACAATVVPSVLLGGSSSTLVTSAYAVTRKADGTVSVTIYDIATAADGARLQRALRAEGVPALVWVGTSKNNPSARRYARHRPAASNRRRSSTRWFVPNSRGTWCRWAMASLRDFRPVCLPLNVPRNGRIRVCVSSSTPRPCQADRRCSSGDCCTPARGTSPCSRR